MSDLPPPSGSARPGPPPTPDGPPRAPVGLLPLPEGTRYRGIGGWIALAIVVAVFGFGFLAFPLFAWVFGAPVDPLRLLAAWGLAALASILTLSIGIPLAVRANRRRPWVRWPAILVCVLSAACWVIAWFPVNAIASPVL